MLVDSLSIDLFTQTIGFSLFSALVAFIWAPVLINFLYKKNIVRSYEYDPTHNIKGRSSKENTPVMGGLLVIVTVALITFLFNWDRSFTWVPIGVMAMSALLGGIDDFLNIFGSARRSRSLSRTITLIKVHKNYLMRIWLILTLPWTLFKRLSVWLSSNPGRGLHVHEKLILQFLAGLLTAWWIFFKLGAEWQEIYLPFDGFVNIGFWIIPLIVLVVIFTANAVNIADGLDGLAGGSLIITFGGLTLLAAIQNLPEIALLNATTMGALIPYTYFNIKPARFQMGDVGSLGLGSLLAVNTIVLNQILIIPLLAFIFYIEAGSVIIQIFGRQVLKKRIFKMAPLHHHFEMLGWQEEKIVNRFWVIHLVVVLLAIWIALH